MSNGVEVIVATDRTVRPVEPEFLRLLSSTVTRPITLAPHTLTNHMSMILSTEKEGENDFVSSLRIANNLVTRTYYTTYTYLSTVERNGETAVSTAKTTIKNVKTEEEGSILPTSTREITLTQSPSLQTEILHTTYTYINTIIDGEQPLVMTSRRTVANTVTGQYDYFTLLEPSETYPTTNTYLKTVEFTKTLTDGVSSQIISTKNLLTQVIVTDVHDREQLIKPMTTEVTKTYFVTYTYFSTYIDGDRTRVKSDVSVSSDVTIEKFYIKPKKTTVKYTQKMTSITRPTPMNILATKTYLTTFTYFTTLLQGPSGEKPETIVTTRTRVMQNVVTETLPQNHFNDSYHVKLQNSLEHRVNGNIVGTATLKDGEKMEVTVFKGGTAPGHAMATFGSALTEMESSEQSDNVSTYAQKTSSSSSSTVQAQPYKNIGNEITAEALVAEENEVVKTTTSIITTVKHTNHRLNQTAHVPITPTKTIASSSTAKREEDTTENVQPNKKPQKQTTDGSVNFLNLTSLGINGINVLGPVFNAMAELINNNIKSKVNDSNHLNKEHVVKKPSVSINPLLSFVSGLKATAEPKQKSTTPRTPVYIPVGSFAEEPDVSESQSNVHVVQQWQDTQGKNLDKNRIDNGITILEGGIPISPGQIITTNSDVIIGRPGSSGPRPPQFAIKNNVPIDMKPPPPPLTLEIPVDDVIGQQSTITKVKPGDTKYRLKHKPHDSGTLDLNPPPAPPSLKVPQPITINLKPHEIVPYQPDHVESNIIPIPVHLIDNYPAGNIRLEAAEGQGNIISNPTQSHVIIQNDHVKVNSNMEDRSTGHPLLVNIQPSQVANVVIPPGISTALIINNENQHSLKGEVIDDPSPHPEPETVGFVGAEPVLRLEGGDITPPLQGVHHRPQLDLNRPFRQQSGQKLAHGGHYHFAQNIIGDATRVHGVGDTNKVYSVPESNRVHAAGDTNRIHVVGDPNRIHSDTQNSRIPVYNQGQHYRDVMINSHKHPLKNGPGIYIDVSPPGHLPPRPDFIHGHGSVISNKPHGPLTENFSNHQSGLVHDVPLNAQVQLGSSSNKDLRPAPIKDVLINANKFEKNKKKHQGSSSSQNFVKAPQEEMTENLYRPPPPPPTKQNNRRPPWSHPPYHTQSPTNFMIPPPQVSHRPNYKPPPEGIKTGPLMIPVGAGAPEQPYPHPRPEDIIIVPHNIHAQQTNQFDLDAGEGDDPLQTEDGEEIQASNARPLLPGQLPSELERINNTFDVQYNSGINYGIGRPYPVSAHPQYPYYYRNKTSNGVKINYGVQYSGDVYNEAEKIFGSKLSNNAVRVQRPGSVQETFGSSNVRVEATIDTVPVHDRGNSSWLEKHNFDNQKPIRQPLPAPPQVLQPQFSTTTSIQDLHKLEDRKPIRPPSVLQPQHSTGVSNQEKHKFEDRKPLRPQIGLKPQHTTNTFNQEKYKFEDRKPARPPPGLQPQHTISLSTYDNHNFEDRKPIRPLPPSVQQQPSTRHPPKPFTTPGIQLDKLWITHGLSQTTKRPVEIPVRPKETNNKRKPIRFDNTQQHVPDTQYEAETNIKDIQWNPNKQKVEPDSKKNATKLEETKIQFNQTSHRTTNTSNHQIQSSNSEITTGAGNRHPSWVENVSDHDRAPRPSEKPAATQETSASENVWTHSPSQSSKRPSHTKPVIEEVQIPDLDIVVDPLLTNDWISAKPTKPPLRAQPNATVLLQPTWLQEEFYRNRTRPNKPPSTAEAINELLPPPKPTEVVGLSPPPPDRPRRPSRPQRPKPPFKFDEPTTLRTSVAIENDFPPVRSPDFNKKPIKPQDIFPPKLPDNFVHHVPDYTIRPPIPRLPPRQPVTSLPIDIPETQKDHQPGHSSDTKDIINLHGSQSEINGHSKPVRGDEHVVVPNKRPKPEISKSTERPSRPAVAITPTRSEATAPTGNVIWGSETIFEPEEFNKYKTPVIKETSRKMITTLITTGSTTIFADFHTPRPIEAKIKPTTVRRPIPVASTYTTTYTVTTTMTTVIHSVGQKPSTKTILLTKTILSTILNKVTETQTLVKPTTATVTQTHTIATTKTALVVPTAIHPSPTKGHSGVTLKPEIFVADPHSKDTMTISLSTSLNKDEGGEKKHNSRKPESENDSILVVMTNKHPKVNLSREDFDGGLETVKGGGVLVGGVFNADPTTRYKTPVWQMECVPECRATRNERCQKVDGSMKCVCRPGFARMFPDRPCMPTYTYNMKLVLDMAGKEYIDDLMHSESTSYLKLKSLTKEGLDRLVMQSDLRDVFHGVLINGFQPMQKKTMVDFYVQLSENTDESRLMDVFKKTLRHSNYSLGGTELYATRESGMLEAEDFNECLNAKFHDCSENARCFNLRGTYTCSCKEGFTDLSENSLFPGRMCSDMIGCEYCGYHGTCYTRDDNQITCECFQWYSGERCRINLKVLLIALVTIGSILLALLLLCGVLTCLKRKNRSSSESRGNGSSGYLRYRGPPTQSLDKRAMIAADSSSESSVENLPYINPPPPPPPSGNIVAKRKPVLRQNMKGPAPRPKEMPAVEQQDRSVTVMIPRAKYRPVPPMSPLLTMSTFSPDKHIHRTSAQISTEQKLINYLEGNSREGTSNEQKSNQKTYDTPRTTQPLKKEQKVFEYEYKTSNMQINDGMSSGERRSSKHGDSERRFRRHSDSTHLTSDNARSFHHRKYSAGALVSAGFEVSATVGLRHDFDTSEDEHSGILNTSTMKSNRSQFTTLNRTGDHKTMSEARSYDETTIHPPTRTLKTNYSGSSPSSRVNNDEGHTMVERDLGSTFIMPESHLFKPERDRGSDISTFDSL